MYATIVRWKRYDSQSYSPKGQRDKGTHASYRKACKGQKGLSMNPSRIYVRVFLRQEPSQNVTEQGIGLDDASTGSLVVDFAGLLIGNPDMVVLTSARNLL